MDKDKKTFDEYFLNENGIGSDTSWSEAFKDTFHTRDPVMVAPLVQLSYKKFFIVR